MSLENDVELIPQQETEIKTAEMIKEELKQLKYKNYCINFKSRLEQWSASHDGRTDYPIRYDSEYGDFVWLNRNFRRNR